MIEEKFDLKVYHDGGGGVTAHSEWYWKKHIQPSIDNGTWRLHSLTATAGGILNTQFMFINNEGNPVVVLLSGFSMGYPGTATHGLQSLLAALGGTKEMIRAVKLKDYMHCQWD